MHTHTHTHTHEVVKKPYIDTPAHKLTHTRAQGLVEVVCLKHIVRMVGVPVHELFDVIGGTSTGGILSVSLGGLRMNPDEAQEMYLNLTSRIFERHGLKFTHTPLSHQNYGLPPHLDMPSHICTCACY